MSTGLVYLASPYNHPSAIIRKERFEKVCIVASRLMIKGVHLFCPIAHTHPIAECGNLPKGWRYWQEYDRTMLNACKELWIVQLNGWEESVGIKGEIEIAKSLGLIIRTVDPQTCYISQPITKI